MAVIGSIVTAFKVAGLAAVRAAVRTLTAGLARLGAAGVRAMAAFATKTLAAAAALKALAVGGTFAVIKKSLDDTVEQMKTLKSLASLMRMPPEFVSFFEGQALEVGIDKQDLTGIFSGFAAAAQEAAADTDSEFAKVFQALGVRVTETNGKMRKLNEVFIDVAQNSLRLDPATRGFRLNQIFGDDDAQKVSPLLDRLGQMGKPRINALYQQQLADGEIVRQSDINAMQQYTKGLGALGRQLTTIKRLIAVDIGPKLATIFEGLAKTLKDNKVQIVAFFTDVYTRTEKLAADILVVFGGVDVDKLFRIRNDVRNTWLFQLKEGLLQAVEIAKLLGKGFVAIGRAADTTFKKIFGFSLESWAKEQTVDSLQIQFTKILDYIRRFILDLGLLFQGLFTSTYLQTSLGKGIGEALDVAYDTVTGFVDRVSKTIDTIVTYFKTAFGEIRAVFDFGQSAELANTALGLIVGTVVELSRSVQELFNQFEKVFKLNEKADAGYEWVDDLHTVLTAFVGTLTTFVEIMQTVLAPLQSIISLFGDWSAAGTLLAGTVLFNITNALTGGLLGAGIKAGITALITQLGTAGLAGAFAGLLNPIGLATTAIGLLIAGYVALKKLSDDDRDRGLEKARQLNDASFDRYGAKPGSGYRSPANTNSASPVLSREEDEYIQKVALEVPGIPRDVLVKMSRSELDYMVAFNGRKVS